MSRNEDVGWLGRNVRNGVSKFRGLGTGDQLKVEILSQLVEGRRTRGLGCVRRRW